MSILPLCWPNLILKKPAKFLYRDVLIEVNYPPWSDINSPEIVLGEYRRAGGFDRQTFFLTHPESYLAYSAPCRMTSPSVVESAGDAKTRCATLWDSSNGSTSGPCITIRSHAGFRQSRPMPHPPHGSVTEPNRPPSILGDADPPRRLRSSGLVRKPLEIARKRGDGQVASRISSGRIH